MCEIVIDTETTGLDPLNGDRIVEIGAVELVNRSLTGHLCPERSIPADALAVHGLSAEFLADKPLFGVVADASLAFVGDVQLEAHNAGRAEARGQAADCDRAGDPTVLARRKHAGGLKLDELCARYGVDRSRRTQHGALLDAELLAGVYVELTTARQATLRFEPIAVAPAQG